MMQKETDKGKSVVNICGIPHTIEELPDNFDRDDTQLGFIDHSKARITINKNVPESVKTATICHEIVHGILVQIGRGDLSSDETFVTCLGNAINNTFSIKYIKGE